MKYRCLVFDHDDTVVNSTASIHYPSFVEYLALRFPEKECCTLEGYFLKNFDPGYIAMCREDYGLTEEDILDETQFWREYVSHHIPTAYEGIKEIMDRQKAEGGLITVVSHSMSDYILRDYAHNRLPVPDAVFGWDSPPEQRKPSPYPLQEIMRRFHLAPEDLIVIDDLKPGFDMARAAGVDFAAAGWSNDIRQIEDFMRSNSEHYFKTIPELAEFLK